MISNEKLPEQEMRQLLESQGFQILEKIGHGTFGQVFLVHHPDLEEEFVAAKVIMNEDFIENEWSAFGVPSEDPSQINPFIVRNIRGKQFDKMTVILMEYCNMGTLFDLIQAQKDIPIPIIRVIMRQILQGLSYIHSKGIIHRDIKGGNILMHSPTGSGRVILKIADFGTVKKNENILQQTIEMSQQGTPAYMAPDLFLVDAPSLAKADAQVDMWSVGILLYQISTHTFPYNPHNKYEIQQFLAAQELDRPYQIKDNLLWDLLVRMLQFDRHLRISAAEALQHPFFAGEQAMREITLEQIQLAQDAQVQLHQGDQSITQFDLIPAFIFPLTEEQKLKKKFKLKK
ncbi:MAG: putative Mitogen-activated protein kinase kinase kinase NPK1 [Streblomastix strix]|uniref:Putative Mitogen-activated protein kinase kinase kinase NPK1 n=1 Tax=Streblomastix strix TaxID=222440 RepID=A0A5J4VYH0_9EUKA|nr:MAG: putative Mitogen-activated protein kinase kinase kinase NPK1 [Streblomastix strix]